MLEYGGNDCNFNWKEVSEHPDKEHLPVIPPERFAELYREVVNYLRDCGATPIIILPPPIDADKFLTWICRDGLSRENILKWLGYVEKIYETHKSYSDAVAEIAQERIVPLVDVRSAFPSGNALGEYMCIDGVHPDKKGYQLIADSFASFFEKALA